MRVSGAAFALVGVLVAGLAGCGASNSGEPPADDGNGGTNGTGGGAGRATGATGKGGAGGSGGALGNGGATGSGGSAGSGDAASSRDAATEGGSADGHSDSQDSAMPQDSTVAVSKDGGRSDGATHDAGNVDGGSPNDCTAPVGSSKSFCTTIFPILQKHCAGCHDAPHAGKFDTLASAIIWLHGQTTCATAVDKHRVMADLVTRFPNDEPKRILLAKDAYLIHKLTNTAPLCGSPMPKAMPFVPLAADDLAKIADWIQHGGG